MMDRSRLSLKATCACLVWLAVCGCAPSLPEEVVYLGPERHSVDLLLHDDLLVAESSGVAIEPATLEKHLGNPVLVHNKPWEIGSLNYTCVVHDVEEGAYKMWYQMVATAEEGVRRSACHYAVSRDGLNWEKPALGLVEFDGSAENNILFVESENVRGTPSYWVIKDYAEPDSARRYKMMRHSWDFQGRAAQMGWSPDGIHWTFSEFGNMTGSIDSQNVFFWDNRTGQYVGYFRSHASGLRSVARATSPDTFHWSRMTTVHSPDERDPPTWHLYTPGIWKLGLARQTYVMVTTGFDEESHEAYGQLGVSRDGINWHRFRQPFLPLGGEGDWDGGAIYTVAADATIGQRTAIFYHGSNSPAHSREGQRGIGVAFLDRGGFVGRRADGEGYLVTRPLRVSDNRGRFYLLADVSPDGSIAAELLSKDGTVLEGFSRNESAEIEQGGDALEIRWENQEKLKGHLRAGSVRLKLYLRKATVYGLRVHRPR